jgi:hypothetical protein
MPICRAALVMISRIRPSPAAIDSASALLRIFPAVGGLDNSGGDGQPAGDRFQAAAATAATERPVGQDPHVADLHARPRAAAQQFALIHAAAANARAGKNTQHAVAVATRTETVLAVDARIHVVENKGRALELLLKELLEPHLRPA